MVVLIVFVISLVFVYDTFSMRVSSVSQFFYIKHLSLFFLVLSGELSPHFSMFAPSRRVSPFRFLCLLTIFQLELVFSCACDGVCRPFADTLQVSGG